MSKILLTAAACLALGACASIPQPISGEFGTATPRDAASANGSQVRWGGEIVETVPGTDHTCIYALSRPLDRQARPETGEDSMGRFVACHPGFYDPEIFARGREITVTGTVDGTVTRKVGDYDYPYPRVNADNIYLWPRPVRRSYAPYPGMMYGSFWGPGYWDPFWYRPPTVIVVPRPTPPPGK